MRSLAVSAWLPLAELGRPPPPTASSSGIATGSDLKEVPQHGHLVLEFVESWVLHNLLSGESVDAGEGDYCCGFRRRGWARLIRTALLPTTQIFLLVSACPASVGRVVRRAAFGIEAYCRPCFLIAPGAHPGLLRDIGGVGVGAFFGYAFASSRGVSSEQHRYGTSRPYARR